MCNPAIASMVTQGAGATTSAFGSIFSAQSQRNGLNLDAYFADLNAKVQLDNSREALRQGDVAETRADLQTAEVKSSQRAAMAANGVDLSTGSALDRQTSTDMMGAIDAATIRQNAAREAAGYRTEASNQSIQANMNRAGARGINPLLSGVSSLVGSAGHIATDWYRLTKAGAFSGNGSGTSYGYRGDLNGIPLINFGGH